MPISNGNSRVGCMPPSPDVVIDTRLPEERYHDATRGMEARISHLEETVQRLTEQVNELVPQLLESMKREKVSPAEKKSKPD
jgi:hypothetical protein